MCHNIPSGTWEAPELSFIPVTPVAAAVVSLLDLTGMGWGVAVVLPSTATLQSLARCSMRCSIVHYAYPGVIRAGQSLYEYAVVECSFNLADYAFSISKCSLNTV